MTPFDNLILGIYRTMMRWGFLLMPVSYFVGMPFKEHSHLGAVIVCWSMFLLLHRPPKVGDTSPPLRMVSPFVLTVASLAMVVVLMTAWCDPIYWTEVFSQRILASTIVALSWLIVLGSAEVWTLHRQAVIAKRPGFEVILPARPEEPGYANKGYNV